MTVVVGTAGHIDHGKTTLLRALTGIDADRLPEERRRGMTIDVGYAHLALADGSELDFVDVPGHDRLVGNMLVGAGEIDAALLVVAADDGIRAQTREHLALLDALGVAPGVAVITKVDIVDAARVAQVAAEVTGLLVGTSLAGGRVIPASGVTGVGMVELLAALTDVRDAVLARGHTATAAGARLAVDRVFAVKGRGLVVTGTLRGDALAQAANLRVVPGDGSVRVREIQVHGHALAAAPPGRTALNLAGVDADRIRRGTVLTSDPSVVETSRMLVRLDRTLADRARARLHLGTAAVDAAVGRSGRDALELADGRSGGILRLADPIAAAPGDRFVLRRSGVAHGIVGGVVIDAGPARGPSRRRQTVERVAELARAVDDGDASAIALARLALHGLLAIGQRLDLAPDVEAAAAEVAIGTVAPAATLAATRAVTARAIRRLVTSTPAQALRAASQVVDEAVVAGRIVQDGDRLRAPGSVAPAPDPALSAALDRLERALSASAPPPLSEAARMAGCPEAGIRDLERSGRIVILGTDLAYATSTYRALTTTALSLATARPLTPSAYRDATGTSRKFVMAILEDLDRRGILRRTPDGHIPGPRASAGITTP